MDRDTIIRLAREAGAVFPADGSWHKFEVEGSLERFAALVAAHEQEPVAWRYRGNLHEFDPSDWAEGPVTLLYTAPTPRKPLTDEEIEVTEQRVWNQTVDKGKTQGEYAMKFARAIERAHGIGEQHE